MLFQMWSRSPSSTVTRTVKIKPKMAELTLSDLTSLPSQRPVTSTLHPPRIKKNSVCPLTHQIPTPAAFLILCHVRFAVFYLKLAGIRREIKISGWLERPVPPNISRNLNKTGHQMQENLRGWPVEGCALHNN